MPAKPVYIHYGSDVYNTPDAIQNRELFTKPRGGLWASRRDDDCNTWKTWCECEKFRLDKLNYSFEFTLKDSAKVLELNDVEQLNDLPKLKPWNKNDQYDDCLLDFEKLATEYDAIELRNICDFYWPLYGWDCNSILIMNPDIVEVSYGKS